MQTKVRTSGVKKSVQLKELQDAMDMFFVCLKDLSYKEISNMTGLAVGTLCKYKNQAVTMNVRFGTVQVIALAAGFKVEFAETGIRLWSAT